jgi:hypothetical protein
MSRLCAGYAVIGPRYNVGLGFYAKLRFHVDSWKYRTWGRNDHGTLACPSPLVRSPPPVTPVVASGPVAAPVSGPPAGPSVAVTPPVDPLAPR